MSRKDPVDEVAEQTFPASDAPPFSGAHAGLPADRGVLQILIDLPPGSADAVYFRTALARFEGRVVLTFAAGEAAVDGADFARALPDADVVVTAALSDDELVRAP